MKFSKRPNGKQRKWGKDGYLSDFHSNTEGRYVYTGETWQADPSVLRQYLKKLWILQAVILLAAVFPGLVTTAGLLNSFYVILPYVFWLISAIVMAYTLGKMTFGGNPMRKYVYERSVARYSGCAMAPLAGAALTAVGLIVFLVRGGTGEGILLCFLCCAVQAAASIAVKKCRISEIWTRSQAVKSESRLP